MLWVLQAVLALSFGSAAVQKLGGSAYMSNVFDEIGFGAWFRYAVGVVELVGVTGLLVPTFSGAAAIGLVIVALGGTITNATIGENPVFPRIFLLLAIAVAWGRWPNALGLVRGRADRARGVREPVRRPGRSAPDAPA